MPLSKEELAKRMQAGRTKKRMAKQQAEEELVELKLDSLLQERNHKPDIEVTIKKKPEDIISKRDWKHSWYYFTIALVGVSLGLPLALLGNSSGNPILIVLGFGVMAAGGLSAKAGYENFTVRRIVRVAGKRTKTTNSFNIYPRSVAFEDEPKPLGMQWKCLNDGKYYHVHFKDIDGTGSMRELELPDNDIGSQYYDPKEAVNCITMPLNEKYFNYLPNDKKDISIWVMVIVNAILVLGLIVIP
jgi:hypothetical protein